MKKRLIIIMGFTIVLSGIVFFGVKLSRKKIVSFEKNSTSTLEELKALPYASWSESKADESNVGVVRYDLSKAFPGYNLYTDDREYAFLMDMSGEVVHRWQFPKPGKWEYFRLLENGKIVALAVGKYLAKLDRNSNVIWLTRIGANHDIEILADGSYLVPCYKRNIIYKGRKVQFDAVFHISSDGRKLDEWWTFEHLDSLRKLHPSGKLDYPESGKIKEKTYDYYHLNTIAVLPRTPLGKKDKRFQEGNWLLCLRNANLIVILDRNSKEVVWHWGPGIVDWPHAPTMLGNGNILIFDNGTHRAYSRVIEINPVNGQIVWEYKAEPPEGFHSRYEGNAQRLANGNTLICESRKGRAFEVTPEGEIVWEFFGPEIKEGKRKLIYRLERVTDPNLLVFLKEPQTGERRESFSRLAIEIV